MKIIFVEEIFINLIQKVNKMKTNNNMAKAFQAVMQKNGKVWRVLYPKNREKFIPKVAEKMFWVNNKLKMFMLQFIFPFNENENIFG